MTNSPYPSPPDPSSTVVSLSYTDSPLNPPKPLSVSKLDYKRAMDAREYLVSTLEPGRLEPDVGTITRFLETCDDLVLLGGVSRSNMVMNEMVARVVKLFELRLELRQLENHANSTKQGVDDEQLEEQLVKIEVGLTLLTPGTKSSKLSRAYKLLSSCDDDEDPNLTTSELTDLFEAFLTAIFATVSSSNELDVDEADSLISAISDYAAAKVTQYAGRSKGITFDDFGTWYNQGGFESAPWLELLDLDKWTHGSKSSDITITENDLNVLKEVVEESGMGERTPEEITQFLTELSNDGILSYSTVVNFVQEILPSSNLRAQNLILVLYGLLDREESGQIEVADFAAGFTIFCAGNKSSKLAVGFQQFDDDEDDKLSRRGLWRFLRSFLAALISVSLASETDLENPLEAIYDALDSGAVWTASQIFDYISNVTGDNSGLIGFEEFASWYTEGDGYKLAPWLELLDLGKFLSLSSAEAAEGDDSDEEEDSYSQLPSNQAYDEEIAASVASSTDTPMDVDRNLYQLVQQGVLFSFPLASSSSLDVLYLTQHDVEYVKILVGETGLDAFDPDDVFGFFSEKVQWRDAIDRSTFLDALNSFVLANHSRNLDSEVLNVFSNFFSCYDEFDSGTTKLAELMWGISLFCKGEKSVKLAFGFELFDTREQGSLSDEQLFEFLYSLLTMIFSCTSQGLAMSTKEMLSIVGSTAAELTQAVMRSIYDQGKQRVTFDDFGDWYNAGGFEVSPWLELLALRKWTDRYEDLADTGGIMNEEEKEEEEESEEEESEEEEEDYYDDEEHESEDENDHYQEVKPPNSQLTFIVKSTTESPGIVITFSQSDIEKIAELVTATGLHTMPFRYVCEKFLGKADEGSISKAAFDSCIRELIPKSNMDADTRRRLSGVLSGIFKAFDRERSQSVDALEFASGFSIFCAGSKSDKLAYSFEILDSDMDGKLTRRGMWRFARGFLTVLLSISDATNSVDDQLVLDAVDDGSVWVSASVFGFKFADGGKFVEFDAFADWYTEGGYVDSSWFELLDLKKWCKK